MKRWSQYRAVLLPTVLLTLLMLGFAWYATGVVDRDRAMEQAENRLVQMSQKIDALQSEQSLILDEAQADYQTRARIISMMINTTPTLLETETDLEELRLVAGAEVISVSDLQGVIRFSTDQSRVGDRVEDAFLPAITNKVFSEWYFPDESTRDILLVGTARLDQDGVIQITFKPDDISQLMQSADLSELVSGTQFMENGNLSVLDESCRYMSHTYSALVGAQSPYAPADFSGNAGHFSASPYQSSALVCYRKYRSYTLVCTLPYREVYARRNSAALWMLALGALLDLTAGFCVTSRLHRDQQ